MSSYYIRRIEELTRALKESREREQVLKDDVDYLRRSHQGLLDTLEARQERKDAKDNDRVGI